MEETRDDECLSEGFRHLVVKLIRRNDLEGLQKTYRSSNRYWPIEDLVYFMEVMIQYSRQGFTDQNRVHGPSQS